jgi:hypothetical protein
MQRRKEGCKAADSFPSSCSLCVFAPLCLCVELPLVLVLAILCVSVVNKVHPGSLVEVGT